MRILGATLAGLGLVFLSRLIIPAHADVILVQPTPVASVDRVRVVTIILDYRAQVATVYYARTDANGETAGGGGSVTVPFPNPTPGVLGTLRTAAEKTLAGYPTGGMGEATPVAVGTVTP